MAKCGSFADGNLLLVVLGKIWLVAMVFTAVHRHASRPQTRSDTSAIVRMETTLYRVVQEHLDTYLAFVDIETGGTGLPAFVTDEFDAFLACGILAHGFLRLRCDGCAEEKLVAFSCKRRGICPSCGTRRMAEAAAHLVDHEQTICVGRC